MKHAFVRYAGWLGIVVVVIAGLYCYYPGCLYFQNDDFIHLQLSAEQQIFQRNAFRPICDISVIIDQVIWKKQAYGYHSTNLLLHLLTCVLVYIVSKKICRRYFSAVKGAGVPAAVAILFFVYAMHSESVLWILGRSGILGLLLSLLFFWFYLQREKGSSYILAYAVTLVMSLLAYESSFVLPLYCIVIAFIDRKQHDIHHVVIVWFLFIIYLILRYIQTSSLTGEYELSAMSGDNFTVIILTNYAKLLYRSFFPAYTQGIVLMVLFALIFSGLITAFLLLKEKRKLAILFLFFLISLVPYVTLGIDAHGYEGERYLYMPSFFLCLFTMLVLHNALANRWKNLVYYFILLVHVLSLFVSSQNFRLAGRINKMLIKQVQRLPAASTIIITELPQAQNGALVLRDGLREAIVWLTDVTPDKVIVQSQRSEWQPLRFDYRAVVGEQQIHKTIQKIESDTFRIHFTDSIMFIGATSKYSRKTY